MQPAQIETTSPNKTAQSSHLIAGVVPDVEYGYMALAWRRLKRDRAPMLGAGLGLLIIVTALFAPLLAPHDPTVQYQDGLTPDGQPISSTLLQGSWRFPLGTDANGRDLLSRIIYGARVSLLVGVLANLLAVTLGTLIGASAAFWRDPVESILMRFTEIMLAFPMLLFAMALVAILK